MSADATERLAELAVRFGANVQRGQIVSVGTEPGKEELTRAVAVQAYKAGAKFVDVTSFDLHVKRARILHAKPRKIVDVEETPVIDLVERGAPVREAVGLYFEQGVEMIEASGLTRHAVDLRNHAVDVFTDHRRT